MTRLLHKPNNNIDTDIIEIPFISYIECIALDDIPATTTIDNAKQIVRELDYILEDIAWQVKQKEANKAFNEIKLVNDKTELVKMRLMYYNWISKVSSVARSTGAKRFLYSEALKRAGIET